MGLFRKPTPTYDYRQEMDARIEWEKEYLEKIHTETDPIAAEAMRIYSALPDSQKQQFIKNVFSGLVIQAIHSADRETLIPGRSQFNFGVSTIWRFGQNGGLGMISISDDLKEVIRREALGTPVQGEFEFELTPPEPAD